MAWRIADKTVGGIRILGFTVAGEESVVALPELDVAFDTGRAPREIIPINHVCLTHGHMDHAAGLAYYFSQRNFQGTAPGCVIVHRRLAAAVGDLLQVWGRIEGHVSPGRIVGVDADEDFEVRRGLIVRPFGVRHSSVSLGFTVIEVRKKLKPEYAEYSGQQLAALKKQGTTIENRLEIPLVAYPGDTAVGSWLDLDHVRNAEVLMCECTFFDDDHVDRARQGQHIHVKDLPGILERVRNRHVVLTHLTRRTGIGHAKHVLSKMLSKEDQQRVSLLMDFGRRQGGQSATDSGSE